MPRRFWGSQASRRSWRGRALNNCVHSSMGDFRSVSTCTRFGRFTSIFPASNSGDFNARFARLAVLYEDLSLEIHGINATAGLLATLERNSDAYRRNYFLRRAIGTLYEFAEAVRALDRTPDFASFGLSFNPEQSRAWIDAKNFFDSNFSMIKKIRNDVGGHFGEAASRYAVAQTDPDIAVSLTVESDVDRSRRLTVGFAGHLAATALFKHAPGGESEDKARFVIELLLKGVKHSMDVVFGVFGPSVWHKLGK